MKLYKRCLWPTTCYINSLIIAKKLLCKIQYHNKYNKYKGITCNLKMRKYNDLIGKHD